jgi:hypothetical protein
MAHVIHATREAKGRWVIGCIFDCALSEKELQTFFQD